MDKLDLKVVEIHTETPLIRALRLARTNDEPLPSWEPGSHIKVKLPSGDERSYSLINSSTDPSATTRPHSYLVGVRLETPSTGGSVYMHALTVGESVAVTPPSNNFPLEPSPAEIVLVAGGIGITPILSMAAYLEAAGHAYRLIYAGRSREQLAFLNEVERLVGSRLRVHTDDEAGKIFNIAALMSSLTNGEPLYVCGPKPMIDAALAEAARLGWDDRRLRFEIFAAVAPQAGDTAFEVVLNSSGKAFTIPPDKTILDVLIEAGEDPMHDCRRGDCGICQVAVLEGEPDHRDYILSERERAENKVMQICISRAKTARLVLDL
jgi:vanillate O-demethylase ferredoxin subunit